MIEAGGGGTLDGERFAGPKELTHLVDTLAMLGGADRKLLPNSSAKLPIDVFVEAAATVAAIDVARALETVVAAGESLPNADLQARIVLRSDVVGKRRVLSTPTRSDFGSQRADTSRKRLVVMVTLDSNAPEALTADDPIWSVFVTPHLGREGEIVTARDQSLAQAADAVEAADDSKVCILVADASARMNLQQALDWLKPVLALKPDDLQWRAR